MSGFDHGPLSGIRRRNTGSQQRRWDAGIESTIDAAIADVKAAEQLDRERLRTSSF